MTGTAFGKDTIEQPQHMQALARANEARAQSHAVRSEIAAGALSLADALADPRAQGVRVDRLLTAQNRWGEDRSGRLLFTLMIRPSKRVGQLTQRQKLEIVERVDSGWGSR